MKNIIGFCVAAVGLWACAHAAHDELPPGARYVNLGSSFAAGSGAGPTALGSPARCYRSSANYAHLLAERLNLTLEDVSCGGATSAHILNAWNELPAQIDTVTRDTRLVTITIGGNDIAYVGNLVAGSCEQGESIRAAGMVFPCPSPFVVPEAAFTTLESNLRDVARQIATRAPQARVVFIQYIALVPETQCAQSRFTETEAAALRVTAARLAEITNRAAAETGATVLRMDQVSAGHTPCDSDPWSAGLPLDYDGAAGAAWHPNARGMAVIAEQLEQTLAR